MLLQMQADLAAATQQATLCEQPAAFIKPARPI
jgi:hypothetical protein